MESLGNKISILREYKILDTKEAAIIVEASNLEFYVIAKAGDSYNYKNIIEISNNTCIIMIGNTEHIKIPKKFYQTKTQIIKILQKLENKIFYKEV